MPVRAYNSDIDYEKVDRFLVEIYRPEPFLSSWLQPRWEYMHYHSLSVGLPFERFGVAEDDGQIDVVELVRAAAPLIVRAVPHRPTLDPFIGANAGQGIVPDGWHIWRDGVIAIPGAGIDRQHARGHASYFHESILPRSISFNSG